MHILEYIHNQYYEDKLHIFLALKEGSIASLIERNGEVFANDKSLSNTLLSQMLQAIDYIAHENIIYRDIKPANILYDSQPQGQYSFYLADFGLCNNTEFAVSLAGTREYVAPEVLQGAKQTTKVDVWSLFVTIAYSVNVGGYRQAQKQTQNEVMTAISDAAAHHTMDGIKEMAIIDPDRRASAAQMLLKLYDGDGLTTPKRQITAWNDSPPTNPPARTAAVATAVIASNQLRKRSRVLPNRTRRPPVLGAAVGEFYQTRRRTRSGAVKKLNIQPQQIMYRQNIVASPVISPVDVCMKM